MSTATLEKPDTKAPAVVKKRVPLQDRLVTKLSSHAPRKEGGGTFEVARTSKKILSAVRYTISTGLLPFDVSCGGPQRPGIPVGRITEIYGLDGSGKTALAQRIAARFQQGHIYERSGNGTKRVSLKDVDTTILYIDTEQSIDEEDALVIDGVKLNMVLGRCDTVDQFFLLMEKTMDMVEAEEAETKRPQFLLVILDTIAGLASKEELSMDWNKDDYSRVPKMLKRAFRMLVRRIARSNVAMVCCNQVSNKFEKKAPGAKTFTFGPQEADFAANGGLALRFFARLRVFVHKVKAEYRLVKGALFSHGFVSEFQVIKNSQAPPSRKGRIALLYQSGLSPEFTLLEQFIYLKLAENDEDGGVTFFFSRAGIVPTTFGAAAEESLESMDDREAPKNKKGAKPKKPARPSNPYLERRHTWPAFLQAHLSDFHRLWDHAAALTFEEADLSGSADPTEEIVVSEGDDDDDEDMGLDAEDLALLDATRAQRANAD